MSDSRTLRLQRAMASLVLDEDEAALAEDPGRAARRQGLTLADQQVVADAVESEVAGQIGKRAVEFPQVQQMAHLSSLARKPAGIVIGDPD